MQGKNKINRIKNQLEKRSSMDKAEKVFQKLATSPLTYLKALGKKPNRLKRVIEEKPELAKALLRKDKEMAKKLTSGQGKMDDYLKMRKELFG